MIGLKLCWKVQGVEPPRTLSPAEAPAGRALRSPPCRTWRDRRGRSKSGDPRLKLAGNTRKALRAIALRGRPQQPEQLFQNVKESAGNPFAGGVFDRPRRPHQGA